MRIMARLHLWLLWPVHAQELPTMGSWSYEYQQYWHNIVGATCSSNGAQSPIDIPKQMSLVQAKNLTPLTGQNGMRLGPFAWSLEHLRINVSLHPGPLTWEVHLVNPDDLLVQSEGRTYSLEKMTLKSPSEHTVQGAHHAMELQLHHGTRGLFEGKKHRLITSVSLAQREDAWSNFLDPIFSKMPESAAPAYTFMANPYSDLLPPDKSFVTYSGSTTEPPCDEAVWVVFLEPQYMAAKQLQQFRSSISGYQPSRLAPAKNSRPAGLSDLWDSRWGYNNRHVQELAGRSLMLTQMANAGADAPKLGIIPGSDRTMPLLVCMMLAALLVTGCILFGLLRMRKGPQDGCCEESDSDDARQFYASQQQQQHATLLSPLPDPYMHMAPPRAGFGKHNQIYVS